MALGFLEKYYRLGATVGNGSSAAALISESATGTLLSTTGHFQKVVEARHLFINLMNSSNQTLTLFEKKFVVRQIIETSRAIRIALGQGSIYSGPIRQEILNIIAKNPL